MGEEALVGDLSLVGLSPANLESSDTGKQFSTFP